MIDPDKGPKSTARTSPLKQINPIKPTIISQINSKHQKPNRTEQVPVQPTDDGLKRYSDRDGSPCQSHPKQKQLTSRGRTPTASTSHRPANFCSCSSLGGTRTRPLRPSASGPSCPRYSPPVQGIPPRNRRTILERSPAIHTKPNTPDMRSSSVACLVSVSKSKVHPGITSISCNLTTLKERL